MSHGGCGRGLEYWVTAGNGFVHCFIAFIAKLLYLPAIDYVVSVLLALLQPLISSEWGNKSENTRSRDSVHRDNITYM